MTEIKPYREKPPRPPREITCQRCSIKFYLNTSGRTKYCIECKAIVVRERENEYRKAKRRRRKS